VNTIIEGCIQKKYWAIFKTPTISAMIVFLNNLGIIFSDDDQQGEKKILTLNATMWL